MSLDLPQALRLELPDGTVKRILLEDYLRGVVAAALPADAPLEAMKALAVAARTFAVNTHRHLEHGADVCTTRHCQAWNERANPRAARAVLETRGRVATFDDKLIEAFYFEHCDGKTRDAKGVLMGAPPYLKSVPCPCGFASMKGHGIGMCQRGMLAMARFGQPYNQILEHYYSGITLQELTVRETTEEGEAAGSARETSKRETPVAKREPPVVKRETSNVIPETPLVKRETSKRETSNVTPETPVVNPQAPPVARETVERITPVVKPETPVVKRETPDVTPDTPLVKDRAPGIVPETPKRETSNVPPETPAPARPAVEPEKPVRRTIAPRRAARQKIEQPPEQPAPPAEPVVTLGDAHSPEEDDLLLFLAVEDVAPSVETRPPTPVEQQPFVAPPFAAPGPHTFDAPPPSMPEEFGAVPGVPLTPVESSFVPASAARPPISMPEDMPTESELDFLAPPSGLPEEILAPREFLTPPAHTVEPNLDEFMPPVEKFYAPLDAPPSMPEAIPSFNAKRADETPIAWAPPPPLQENAYAVKPPQVLMDTLPGPRVIAGNLPRVGMLVTIRDARGNSTVTVSGTAKRYGSGGFEAPLTDDGAYHVKFDGTELDVRLENETVFIYYR